MIPTLLIGGGEKKKILKERQEKKEEGSTLDWSSHRDFVSPSSFLGTLFYHAFRSLFIYCSLISYFNSILKMLVVTTLRLSFPMKISLRPRGPMLLYLGRFNRS